MTQIGLQRPGVVPPVGQGITASVAQHVRMDLKAELGLDACAFDHAGEATRTFSRFVVILLLTQSGRSPEPLDGALCHTQWPPECVSPVASP
jgi:hypothetical protein